MGLELGPHTPVIVVFPDGGPASLHNMPAVILTALLSQKPEKISLPAFVLYGDRSHLILGDTVVFQSTVSPRLTQLLPLSEKPAEKSLLAFRVGHALRVTPGKWLLLHGILSKVVWLRECMAKPTGHVLGARAAASSF